MSVLATIRVVSILLCAISLVSTHPCKAECNDDCPVGQYSEGGHCIEKYNISKFGDTVHIRACSNKRVLLLPLGYCMTTADNDSEAYTIACPYDTAHGYDKLVCLQSLTITVTKYSGLNDFMCSNLNRVGEHCKHCNASYGQSVFNLDLSCHPCNTTYSGWHLYLFFELVPLTIFLLVILALQISPTNANMKVFVLFSQLLSIFLSLGSEPLFKHTFGRSSYIFVQSMKTIYGFWNLDFFRSVIPPFCVSSNLNNLGVLTLQYISVVYPTIIIVMAWFLVDLHERGFRPIVAIWRPFRRGLSHFSVTSDPKHTIVSFLATFVTLSYTKVIYITANVTNVVKAQRLCANSSQDFLYLQPDVMNFGSKHAPYIVVSTIMTLLYVILPLLLLLLYSMQCFQDKLNSHCIRSHNIQMFVEAFHSSYNDGSNNKWDTRLFSTVYFFFRIAVVFFLIKSPELLISFILVAFVHGFILALLCIVRPYRNVAYTFLDSFFFFIFIVASVFSAALSANTNKSYGYFLCPVVYTIMALPLVYMCALAIKFAIKWLELVNIRSVLHWKRRGYVEIGAYDNENSNVHSEWDQTNHDHGRRAGQNDSFQSE